MEACNYSDKSSSKLKQQYKEWAYTMRKEGSAFFKTMKNKVKQRRSHFCSLSMFICNLEKDFHPHCLFCCLLE
jgi:hypothetical protein